MVVIWGNKSSCHCSGWVNQSLEKLKYLFKHPYQRQNSGIYSVSGHPAQLSLQSSSGRAADMRSKCSRTSARWIFNWLRVGRSTAVPQGGWHNDLGKCMRLLQFYKSSYFLQKFKLLIWEEEGIRRHSHPEWCSYQTAVRADPLLLFWSIMAAVPTRHYCLGTTVLCPLSFSIIADLLCFDSVAPSLICVSCPVLQTYICDCGVISFSK